jgi:hypothetical protein
MTDIRGVSPAGRHVQWKFAETQSCPAKGKKKGWGSASGVRKDKQCVELCAFQRMFIRNTLKSNEVNANGCIIKIIFSFIGKVEKDDQSNTCSGQSYQGPK